MSVSVTPKKWADWLAKYGAERFYESFVKIAQGAESTCVYCTEKIYLDLVEGGGCVDWKTYEGDYGCECSPDTTKNETGSHVPVKEAP